MYPFVFTRLDLTLKNPSATASGPGCKKATSKQEPYPALILVQDLNLTQIPNLLLTQTPAHCLLRFPIQDRILAFLSIHSHDPCLSESPRSFGVGSTKTFLFSLDGG